MGSRGNKRKAHKWAEQGQIGFDEFWKSSTRLVQEGSRAKSWAACANFWTNYQDIPLMTN
jgi:hypothetical protein